MLPIVLTVVAVAEHPLDPLPPSRPSGPAPSLVEQSWGHRARVTRSSTTSGAKSRRGLVAATRLRERASQKVPLRRSSWSARSKGGPAPDPSHVERKLRTPLAYEVKPAARESERQARRADRSTIGARSYAGPWPCNVASAASWRARVGGASNDGRTAEFGLVWGWGKSVRCAERAFVRASVCLIALLLGCLLLPGRNMDTEPTKCRPQRDPSTVNKRREL